GRPIGSLLAREAVEATPGLNFFPEAVAYVDARIPQVRSTRGTLETDRFRRNMLSSQPLCFNLFGFVRSSDAFADLLGALLGISVASVEAAECEWAPEPSPLRDRTAFDAFVVFTTHEGERRFLGIETKY